MVMTKSDFEALARTIKTVNEDTPKDKRFDRMVIEICNMCKRSNSRFDEQKFLKACGF